MIATIQTPDRLDQQQLDNIASVIRDFHAERARFEGFARELSTEWQQLSDELHGWSVSLLHDDESLSKRQQQLQESQQVVERERQQAREASLRLSKMQSELAACQEECERMQLERDAVRQHVDQVNHGFAAIAELLRIVQSTHDELDQVQATIHSHTAELTAAMGLPIDFQLNLRRGTKQATEPLDVPQTLPQPVSGQPLNSHAEQGPMPRERDEADRVEDQITSSDPVIGSVLAELNRLGKR